MVLFRTVTVSRHSIAFCPCAFYNVEAGRAGRRRLTRSASGQICFAWLAPGGALQVLQGILYERMLRNHESAIEVWKEEET